MRRGLFVLLTATAFAVFAGTALSKELRLAYVDSDRILEANDDFKQARQKLQDEERDYMNQATSLEKVVKQMAEELQTQSLMLSEEARTERQNKFMEKQQELDKFRRETWGDGGKLQARNLELSRPILDKINSMIQKISQEDGYDFVFDASSANIVYALPEHDITDRVIDALKKE
jgi:outer membrane protein